ncbi:copper fist DNA binding domain-containing protein, partial [Mycena olivaceomarginata]
LISSKKYACETCIKGHRSSACRHTDRPLFEIKKKGRPVTQCEHCRELRKTKQVHVKCICEAKEPSPSIAPKKKGMFWRYSLAVLILLLQVRRRSRRTLRSRTACPTQGRRPRQTRTTGVCLLLAAPDLPSVRLLNIL